MRLDWLEDILAVAETGSLSEAAERRNLTQSAFSRRVKAIEDHVGVPLFDRGRKPVQMHAATAEHRERIERLADDLRQLTSDLRKGAQTAGNRVFFASQHALTTSLTPEILRWIGERVPNAYVRLRSANLEACFGLLLSRQVDLAFVYRRRRAHHLIEADFIETLVLGQDRLIPVYAAHLGDDLNRRYQSGEIPVIAYPSGVFLGQIMDNLILPGLRSQAKPVPKVETALTLAALELAQVGVGVAWVPASIAAEHLADGKLVDLSNAMPSAPLDITALRLSGRQGAAQAQIWDRLQSISGLEPGRTVGS
jgi:DNA-binding transcriptional LysR family regulator